jgi:superfamily II RNA helicase
MRYKNFTLDPFQEDSIKAIENNFSVVVSAPTGSGKTLIADYVIDKHRNEKVIYTAPIKALSNQKYRDFSIEFGTDKVGLMTGDIVINPHANILIMTTEVYRNMVISEDEAIKDVAYVIFDEVHFINDIERGYVWEESIIYSPQQVRFLCLSATIPNAVEFTNWIQAIKKHEVKTIVATKRNVPLEHHFYDYELGITTLEKIKSAKSIPQYHHVMRSKRRHKIRVPPPSHIELIKDIKEDKLPCFFFHFSRRACQENARDLARKSLFPKNPKALQIFNQHLKDAPSDVNKLKSTQVLKETITQGIAFHHAGILPILKEAIEDLFSQGLIKVLYVTETFAVGINMPAKTVCFSSLRKFDGRNFRYLNSKEYFQMAGRAGRRGIDKIGYAITMIYRPTFNYPEIKSITSKDMEPIQSQFRLSVNSVLNLINLHSEKEIEHILRMSFYSYQKFGNKYDQIPAKILMSRYNSILRILAKYDYITESETGKNIGKKILTNKGIFSAKIYADEISMGEIFATDFYKDLDEYQILLLLACLVYEHRDTYEFKKDFRNEQLHNLHKKIVQSEYLKREKKFDQLTRLTAIINPIYYGKTFFDTLELTNLLEGDLIRLYAQIIDRIGQIKKARVDSVLENKLLNCKGILDKALEGIYLV